MDPAEKKAHWNEYMKRYRKEHKQAVNAINRNYYAKLQSQARAFKALEVELKKEVEKEEKKETT